MKRLLLLLLTVIFSVTIASAQSNKIVFGPLEGDDAGVLTVRNGQPNVELEVWVRTELNIPVPFFEVTHGLMSDDAIILNRNGHTWHIDYDVPAWGQVWVDGPYVHDSDDNYPIPEGFTTEIVRGIYDYPNGGNPLWTFGEWDYYGSFWMDINTGIVEEETYSPFSRGWYPTDGQSTRWYYQSPPGGSVEPEQDYCGLYFAPDTCIYIPGDCDHNGTPLELSDIIVMLNNYRYILPPYYTCYCPPHGDYSASADPNGNCIANELSDLVWEIAAYRGNAIAYGCADCPGDGPPPPPPPGTN